MRLDQHEVAGFCHFDQPFKVDYRSLPDGLIAMVGPNGAGKTSLGMDAPMAGVYGPGLQGSTPRAFPSREGALADYATSRKAYIEDYWTLEGRGRFRIRVNVDGTRRVVDAVIEEVLSDGSRRPLNDGKVTTFREVVDGLFPSRRALLSFAFAAQNKRGSFSELPQKERIELFVELADLAYLEERAQTAARCSKIADSMAERVKSALAVLRRDIADTDPADLKARIKTHNVEIASLQVRVNDIRKLVEEYRTKRNTLVADAERYATAFARLEELNGVAQRSKAEKLRLQELIAQAPVRQQHEVDGLARTSASAIRALEQRREAAIKEHNAAVIDRAERITNNRKVLDDREKIDAAVAATVAATDEIHRLRGSDAEHRRLRDEASGEITTRTTALAGLAHLKDEIADAEQRAGLLKLVKFGEECGVAPACPLVTNAVEAKAQIPALERRLSEEANLQTEIEKWSTVMASQQAGIEEDKSEIARQQGIIQDNSSYAALAPHLTIAEARIAEYERDGAAGLASHSRALEAIERDITDHRTGLKGAVVAAEARLATTLEELRGSIKRQEAVDAETATSSAECDKTLAACGHARTSLREVDVALATQEAALMTASESQTRLTTEREQLERQLQTAQQRRGTIERAEARLRQIEDEGLAWQSLAKACGRDGIQRIEIDAAGPVVADFANQLLLVGWGSRYSIDIVTQIATADRKDTKEKFTILVTDNLHGGEPRDIGDLSGGEGVVVNEAVRAGLSCYVNLRNRQPCRTIWRDEADGGLAAQSGPAYVAMLRRLLELSGADQLIFITHKWELAALADAQIRVENGTATVALPPYANAA